MEIDVFHYSFCNDSLGDIKEQLTKCSMARVYVILDHIEASNLMQNLKSLKFDGRLFIIGTMSGFVTIFLS